MRPILIATRGSALALVQARMVLSQCQAACPDQQFELTIIKTTGDQLQSAPMSKEGQDLPKGLFTKELEVALLQNKADLAVHSLKDLPTELPAGLKLCAVSKRADVRDVLIYRGSVKSPSDLRNFPAGMKIKDFPNGTAVATGSTRRKAQLLVQNPNLKVPEIRGNVGTRLHKVAERPKIDATILALAGITRLAYRIVDGRLEGENVPPGLFAVLLDTDVMLPCVGQGAIGIETRENDASIQKICNALNDAETFTCVTSERAFLSAMGGGCQSPVAAYARCTVNEMKLSAISFADGPARCAEVSGTINEAVELGKRAAALVRGQTAGT